MEFYEDLDLSFLVILNTYSLVKMMAVENWHSSFSPKAFLSRINLDGLLGRNETLNERNVNQATSPCILCKSVRSPGLLLNDNSYLCKYCFEDVSKISYPEKYEVNKRRYIQEKEAWLMAKIAIEGELANKDTSGIIILVGCLSLFLMTIHIGFIIVPILVFFIANSEAEKNKERLDNWKIYNPPPKRPILKHFHDPSAGLSPKDKGILKIFNNWPGYPPFWNYLREVVLRRDNDRCQVTGCPSRVSLHIHHKVPVSKGGEHTPQNLITLCDFHHSLEPDEGHQRIWGEIKTRYFTLVRGHERKNRSNSLSHYVKPHIRRMELATEKELREIQKFYSFSCPSCKNNNLSIEVSKEGQKVFVNCLSCFKIWEGPRKLTEETGPRLGEFLIVKQNRGAWEANWEMLSSRTEGVFKSLSSVDASKKNIKKKTLKQKSTKPTKNCPKCGSAMKLIEPKPGQRWRKFFGCSQYRKTGCNGNRRV